MLKAVRDGAGNYEIEGVEGAVRAVEPIATGLRWRQVAEPVAIMGEPSKADLEACWELGATVAVSVAE